MEAMGLWLFFEMVGFDLGRAECIFIGEWYSLRSAAKTSLTKAGSLVFGCKGVYRVDVGGAGILRVLRAKQKNLALIWQGTIIDS